MVLPCWMGPAVAAVLLTATQADDPVVGRLDGTDVHVSDLLEHTVAEFGSTERGEAAREQWIQEQLVQREARRRGVEVREDQVEARIREIDQQIRQDSDGEFALGDHLEQQGIARDQFRRLLRRAVLCELMIREDFGLSPGDPVPREKQSIWFAEQRLAARVVTEGLPDGVLARVGDQELDRDAWARILFQALSPEDQHRVFSDLVTIRLLKQAAQALGVKITAADLGEEVRRRDAEVKERLDAQGAPSEGVTYLDMIRARGGDVQEVLDSDKFRASIYARRIAEERFGARGYRDFYQRERAHFDAQFGERWRVSTILLRAADTATEAIPRDFATALEELSGMRERIEEDPAQRDEVFGRMARIYSDHSSRGRGGDLGYLGSAQLEGLELARAVTGAEVGSLQGPVATRDGVHLLLVTAHRPAPGFDELKDEIEREAMRRVTRSLLDSAQIEWLR